MRGAAIYILFTILLGIGSFFMGYLVAEKPSVGGKILENVPVVKDKPYEVYFIENLAKETKPGKLSIVSEVFKNEKYTSYLFEFEFKPNPLKNETKKTTGVINIPPTLDKKAPLVFLIRGYVDQNIYTSGMGSKRVGEYLAENGYITVAPDFLGYAGSSEEATNIFETRFQTYSTAISFHKSLDQIPQWDQKNIFIWAHSNGGQIALSWIAAEELKYPTVLWAPVTKPFPYSILYYTDESADGGKLIRSELAKLEENYDVDKFSFTNYSERIGAKFQFHQGTSDDAIPAEWTSDFVNNLRSHNLEVEYFTYLGDDHNLSKNWKTVVDRTLVFFNNNFDENLDRNQF